MHEARNEFYVTIVSFMLYAIITLCCLRVDSRLLVQTLLISMAALQMFLQCALLLVAAATVAALERFSHRRRRNCNSKKKTSY